jgi:hypothetical protein
MNPNGQPSIRLVVLGHTHVPELTEVVLGLVPEPFTGKI